MKFDLNLEKINLGAITVNNINITVDCSLTELNGAYELFKIVAKEDHELNVNLKQAYDRLDKEIKTVNTNNKYELLKDDYIEHNGRTLYRIKALKDFGDVKTGDLGGYIESEYNLSHYGFSWIYDDAKVYEKAEVYGNAKVCDYAQVYGNAQVFDNSQVCNKAKVYGNAQVYGDAEVYCFAEVYENAKVYEDAQVSGFAQVFDYTEVFDDTEIY